VKTEMARKRKFSSEELREDIARLSEQIGQKKLLVAAVVQTLRKVKPEKYGELLAVEVFQCVRRGGRVRLVKDRVHTGRWWVEVEPEREIVVHMPKVKKRPPDIMKCRACGAFVEKSEEWVINKIPVGVYKCKRCGVKNVWRGDKDV